MYQASTSDLPPYVNHFLPPGSFNWSGAPVIRDVLRSVRYEKCEHIDEFDLYWSTYRRSEPTLVTGCKLHKQLADKAKKGPGFGKLLEEIKSKFGHSSVTVDITPNQSIWADRWCVLDSSQASLNRTGCGSHPATISSIGSLRHATREDATLQAFLEMHELREKVRNGAKLTKDLQKQGRESLKSAIALSTQHVNLSKQISDSVGLKEEAMPDFVLPLLAAGVVSKNWWFRPDGQGHIAHFDPGDNILMQLRGTKRVRLVGPDHLHTLHPTSVPWEEMHPNLKGDGYTLEPTCGKDKITKRHSCREEKIWSPLNVLASGKRFGWQGTLDDKAMSEAVFEVTVKPGDILLVPAAWTHEIVSGASFKRDFGLNFATNWFFRTTVLANVLICTFHANVWLRSPGWDKLFDPHFIPHQAMLGADSHMKSMEQRAPLPRYLGWRSKGRETEWAVAMKELSGKYTNPRIPEGGFDWFVFEGFRAEGFKKKHVDDDCFEPEKILKRDRRPVPVLAKPEAVTLGLARSTFSSTLTRCFPLLMQRKVSESETPWLADVVAFAQHDGFHREHTLVLAQHLLQEWMSNETEPGRDMLRAEGQNQYVDLCQKPSAHSVLLEYVEGDRLVLRCARKSLHQIHGTQLGDAIRTMVSDEVALVRFPLPQSTAERLPVAKRLEFAFPGPRHTGYHGTTLEVAWGRLRRWAAFEDFERVSCQLRGNRTLLLVDPLDARHIQPLRLNAGQNVSESDDRFSALDLWHIFDDRSLRLSESSAPSSVTKVTMPDGGKVPIRKVHLQPGDMLVVPAFWWVADSYEPPAEGGPTIWMTQSSEGAYLVRRLHAVFRNNMWLAPKRSTVTKMAEQKRRRAKSSSDEKGASHVTKRHMSANKEL